MLVESTFKATKNPPKLPKSYKTVTESSEKLLESNH